MVSVDKERGENWSGSRIALCYKTKNEPKAVSSCSNEMR